MTLAVASRPDTRPTNGRPRSRRASAFERVAAPAVGVLRQATHWDVLVLGCFSLMLYRRAVFANEPDSGWRTVAHPETISFIGMRDWVHVDQTS